MKISYSTPIVNLTSSNGYGYAGRNIVDSLKRLGHDVPFQDSKAPFQLNFSQPEYFKLHRNQYQISYTPWESTIIPKRWKPFLDAVDEIWTTSDWCANVFEDNGYKDIKVYPHGIEKIWTPKKREDDGVIKFLHIGEPAPRKGGQVAVDAFVDLFANNPKYSLTLKVYKHNTTRVYNNYLEKEIIGVPYEVYDNIHMIDSVLNEEQLLKLYHDHDVLIYPSYGEGFGFIPLQSLATGMPTICIKNWAHYKKYLGPLQLEGDLIDSPWQHPHEGKVYFPDLFDLKNQMLEVANNFSAYSGYYYAQSTKILEEYDWDRLTKNSFDQVIKKFS